MPSRAGRAPHDNPNTGLAIAHVDDLGKEAKQTEAALVGALLGCGPPCLTMQGAARCPTSVLAALRAVVPRSGTFANLPRRGCIRLHRRPGLCLGRPVLRSISSEQPVQEGGQL